MLWLTKFNKQSKGFSLLEIIVALGLFSIISIALISLIQISLKMTLDDKARNSALVLAEQRLEMIKNLPYNSIGTSGGIPSGDITSNETVVLNNIDFEITTNIIYIDDIYDGTISDTDLLNTDYKQVRIEVDWNSQINSPPVILISNISPPGLEQEESGETGTLWLEVYNNDSDPVDNAQISIINNDVSPAVNISSETNENGYYILPGALPSTQTYQIAVTKAGYNIDQTYDTDPVENPNPNPAHLSIDIEDITTKAFFIDELSDLTLTFKEFGTETVIPGFNFSLTGEKTIGNDGEGAPIYKYSKEFTSDVAGQIAVADIEYDLYTIEYDNVIENYDIAGTSVALPIVVSPGTSIDASIYLTTHASNTLLISVVDASGLPVADANVNLINDSLVYNQTLTTDVNGQVFFTPLVSSDYSLTVSKDGYETFLLEINVNEQTLQTIQLTSL